jgi:nucleoside phosphorylase
MFKKWKQKAAAELKRCIPTGKRKKLLVENCIQSAPAVWDGPIASGPVVGAAEAFKDLLKRLNRRLLALEMEGGGVLAASCSHADPAATLLLRGVSDFGDERKKSLDKIGTGGLRAYAMNNAIRLLWLLLDTGALPRARGAR